MFGTLLLERDGQWFSVLRRDLVLRYETKHHVAYGMAFPSKNGPAVVVGRARIFAPMFASEPVVIRMLGNIAPGSVSIHWNGHPLKVERLGQGLSFSVDQHIVQPGTNILDVNVPVGSTVDKFDFYPTSRWW